METKHFIKGLHHVTATVNDAKEDYDFYTALLGLRLVKKTVNFDNNQVYHFYYGNELGNPGTIMTTFPYKGHNVRQGTKGTGQVAITGFSIPTASLEFWKNRLTEHGVAFEEKHKFGNITISFEDPSGLELELVANDQDLRTPWATTAVSKEVAIRGFYNVTLSVAEARPTFDFFMDEFGFKKISTEGSISRFTVEEGAPGQLVDIRVDTNIEAGKNGIGTVHHVAFRIENDDNLTEMRRHLVEDLKFKVTDIKDRKYFHSIYFRMPGHVLFEIATIPPGFTLDETKDQLGLELKLPDWEEPNREQIESVLPKI